MTQHTITPNVTEAIQSVSKDRSTSYRLQPLFLLGRNAQRHFSSKASSFDAEQACLSLCINHDPNRPRPRQQSQHINGSVFFKIKKQNKTFSNSGFTLLSDYFNKMKMECWASVLARASRSVRFSHLVFIHRKFLCVFTSGQPGNKRVVSNYMRRLLCLHCTAYQSHAISEWGRQRLSRISHWPFTQRSPQRKIQGHILYTIQNLTGLKMIRKALMGSWILTSALFISLNLQNRISTSMCNLSFIDTESEPKGLSGFKVPNRNPENSSFPLCLAYF